MQLGCIFSGPFFIAANRKRLIVLIVGALFFATLGTRAVQSQNSTWQQEQERERQQEQERERQQEQERERQQEQERERQQQAQGEQRERQQEQERERQQELMERPQQQQVSIQTSRQTQDGNARQEPVLTNSPTTERTSEVGRRGTSSQVSADGSSSTQRVPDISPLMSPVKTETSSKPSPVLTAHPVDSRPLTSPVLTVSPSVPKRSAPTSTIPVRPAAVSPATVLGVQARPSLGESQSATFTTAQPNHVSAATVLGVSPGAQPMNMVAAQQQGISGQVAPRGLGIPVDQAAMKPAQPTQGSCANWADDNVTVTALGEDSLFVYANVRSGIVDANGVPSLTGQFLRLQSRPDSKAPFFYGFGGTADQQLAAGQTVVLPVADSASQGNRQQHLRVHYCKQ